MAVSVPPFAHVFDFFVNPVWRGSKTDPDCPPSYLFFTDINGDAGLAYAVRYYWAARNVSMTINTINVGATIVTYFEVLPAARKAELIHTIGVEFDGGTAPTGWIIDALKVTFGPVFFMTDAGGTGVGRYCLAFEFDATTMGEMAGEVDSSPSSTDGYGNTLASVYGAWPDGLGYGSLPSPSTTPATLTTYESFTATLPAELQLPPGFLFFYTTGPVWAGDPDDEPDSYPPPRPALTQLVVSPEYYVFS